MAHIDYFLFPLSPFTYLAGDGLEQIAKKHAATITYKPFNLFQVFEQTGGTRPAERHESRQAYRAQELVRISRMNGMALNIHPAYWPTDPLPSCYGIIAAQKVGGGDVGGLCRSILKSCWAEEKDIAEEAVMRDCLHANGFSPDIAEQEQPGCAQTFAANTQEAVKRNVFGAPSYLVDDQVFWGQDRLAYLDAYLAERAE